MTTETTTDRLSEIKARHWGFRGVRMPAATFTVASAESQAHAQGDIAWLVTEVERLTAENAEVRQQADHHLGIRLEAEKVLDGELGTEEEDGAGEGFVADVALVVERLNDARAEIAKLHRELAVTNGKLGTRGGDISDLLDVNRRLTKENADLRHDLAKAERHDADVRLEAEADVRAELAEKAGA